MQSQAVSPATVLIVEDDPGVREFLANVLEDTYQLRLAVNGREALSVLSSRTVHLMLLDLGLPDMDGRELLRKVEPLQGPIPVIVLTGQHNLRVAVDCMKSGASDFFVKPFDLRDLLGSIHEATAVPIRPSREVLLVGGDRGESAVLRVLLRNRGRVLSVPDAESARQLVSGHAPMLMVLWERLDQGGWTQYANLCRGLGGLDEGGSRVILVAQQAGSAGALHVDPRRIVAIFQRPFRLHELASRIATTIAGLNLATLRFSPQVAYAIEHVREHYQGRCSLGEIAASLGTARGYLVRLVQQELGMTWRRFVRSVRVELVKESYGSGEGKSVEAIAELVGFSDAAHLCRVFRRMVGTSPRQYRLIMAGSVTRAVE